MKQDAINRQNAAFAVGMIAHTCPQQAAPHAPALLTALHGLFRADEEPGARDNAAGAVGRMLLAMGGALPIEQIAPVLAGALPLQEDLEETAPAVAALSQLLASADARPRVAPCLPALVGALARVAAQPPAPADARQQAARAVTALGADAAALVAALPAEQQQALQQLAAA